MQFEFTELNSPKYVITFNSGAQKFPLQISTRKLAVLTEVVRVFAQSLQADDWIFAIVSSFVLLLLRYVTQMGLTLALKLKMILF